MKRITLNLPDNTKVLHIVNVLSQPCGDVFTSMSVRPADGMVISRSPDSDGEYEVEGAYVE